MRPRGSTALSPLLRRRRALARAAVAGSFAGLFALTLAVIRHEEQTKSPFALLAAESSTVERNVEPRLSGGFSWAPFRSAAGERAAGRGLKTAMAETMSRFRGDSSPDARHASGVVQLLAGRPRDALSDLSNAAETANTPSAWNDLAAASYVIGLRYEAPEFFAEALTACDRALAIDPTQPEPLFNRALVIERLGLRDDARDTWERYLAADSTTGWASEAREHLRAVQPVTPFMDLVDRDYA